MYVSYVTCAKITDRLRRDLFICSLCWLLIPLSCGYISMLYPWTVPKLHLWNFRSCVSSCVSSSGLIEKRHRDIFYIYDTFLHCVALHYAPSDVLLDSLLERRNNHSGYICGFFLHCASSNVSLDRQAGKMHDHIVYICVTSPHCVYVNGASDHPLDGRHNHTVCIWRTFLRSALSYACLDWIDQMLYAHTGCICGTFFQCVRPNVS